MSSPKGHSAPGRGTYHIFLEQPSQYSTQDFKDRDICWSQSIDELIGPGLGISLMIGANATGGGTVSFFKDNEKDTHKDNDKHRDRGKKESATRVTWGSQRLWMMLKESLEKFCQITLNTRLCMIEMVTLYFHVKMDHLWIAERDVSVSKLLGFKSFPIFGLFRIRYRKKYRIRYRKNLVSKKVSDSVSEKFGIEKSIGFGIGKSFGFGFVQI